VTKVIGSQSAPYGAYPRAPREKPRGSVNNVLFVFIFRNLLWGSVNYGQSLHGLHKTKRLRTPDLSDSYGRHFLSLYSWSSTLCLVGIQK